MKSIFCRMFRFVFAAVLVVSIWGFTPNTTNTSQPITTEATGKFEIYEGNNFKTDSPDLDDTTKEAPDETASIPGRGIDFKIAEITCSKSAESLCVFYIYLLTRRRRLTIKVRREDGKRLPADIQMTSSTTTVRRRRMILRT